MTDLDVRDALISLEDNLETWRSLTFDTRQRDDFERLLQTGIKFSEVYTTALNSAGKFASSKTLGDFYGNTTAGSIENKMGSVDGNKDSNDAKPIVPIDAKKKGTHDILRLSDKLINTTSLTVAEKAVFSATLIALQDTKRLCSLLPAETDQVSAVRKFQQNANGFVLNVQGNLFERESEAALAALCALAGEHMLLVGPPGTGKSMLCRNLCKFLGANVKVYEFLLNKYTKPDELFGPYSIPLLEHGRLERDTTGYLPTSNVVFLDEIFKATGETLNALLGVLEDRKFMNGSRQEPCPLLTCIGASNELPGADDIDMMPLFDRFLVRCRVDYLKHSTGTETDHFKNMLGLGTSPKDALKLTDWPGLSRRSQAQIEEAAASVTVSDAMYNSLKNLRKSLQEELHAPVSDRRWKKIVRLIRIAAWARGVTTVQLSDMFLMLPCTWQSADEFEFVIELWFKSFKGVVPAKPDEKKSLKEDIGKNFWLGSKEKAMLQSFAENPDKFCLDRARTAIASAAKIDQDRKRWRPYLNELMKLNPGNRDSPVASSKKA